MGDVAVGGLMVAGLVLVGFGMLVWSAWRRVRRRNEVSPASPTRPPLRWLGSPERAARLHRRLRDAVIVLRHAVPVRRGRRAKDQSPLDALAAEIERHAVALDCDLRVVPHLRGPARTTEWAKLTGHIEQLERSAHRLAAQARAGSPNALESMDAALRRISDYLDARDEAWADLARIERDAGLSATA
jgi:hypothetical protein